MPTVYFLCGMPTAGKTTLAKKLQKEHDAVRFTLDQRMIQKTDYSIHDDECRSAYTRNLRLRPSRP